MVIFRHLLRTVGTETEHDGDGQVLASERQARSVEDQDSGSRRHPIRVRIDCGHR